MVKKIEALADAIAMLNDFGNPESAAYQLRNPGLCRAYSFKQLNNVDDQGRRIFSSLVGGYRYLVQDLSWKISGTSRAKGMNGKLKPTSNIVDLLKSFRLSSIENQMKCITFLNMALNTEDISNSTELKYFQEDDNGS